MCRNILVSRRKNLLCREKCLNTTRLEIISDVVSEKTDVVSVFPMWYRNFSATCLSDTTSEIISNRARIFQILSSTLNYVEDLADLKLVKQYLMTKIRRQTGRCVVKFLV